MGKYEYNKIPVHYCKRCLSLAIKKLDTIRITEEDNVKDHYYCHNCGSSEIDESTIYNWEKEYERFYREKYINRDRRLEG